MKKKGITKLGVQSTQDKWWCCHLRLKTQDETKRKRHSKESSSHKGGQICVFNT